MFTGTADGGQFQFGYGQQGGFIQGFFWLDAHASGPLPGGVDGGTPVLQELKVIKKYASDQSVIVIDDCRLFGSAEWSGIMKQEALDIIMEINPNYTIAYEDGEIEKDVLVAYIDEKN